MQKKSYKIWSSILIAVILLAGVCAGLFYYRHRGAEPVSVETSQEYAPENIVYFYQKDDAWKSDALGDSVYTMEDSGCLTACVTSILQMQQISVEGLNADADPGEVNLFFSEHGAYDSEGNLQWDVLEQLTGVSVVKKDAEELADGELDEILSSGCYPIVRVRVGGIGSWHYVLIVGSMEGVYYCMDPLQNEEKLVSLSEFGDQIYAVRYLQK